MTRNVLVVLGAVALSFVLLTAGIWLILQTSPQGGWIRESAERGRALGRQETLEKYGDPFEMVASTVRVAQLALFPAVALLVGAFVGLLGRGAVWQVAALSLTPLLIFVLSASAWGLEGFISGGAYLALCCAAGVLTSRLRRKRSAAGTAHV